jgi:glycerophosphoryl diester phosphodiesterase
MKGSTQYITVAHRGDARRYSENTLEAFQDAIKSGAEFIECDVQETSDGNFIIHHDDSINDRKIIQMTLQDILQLRLADGLHIPTLQQLLTLCEGKTGVFLELKRLRSLNRLARIIKNYVFPPDKFYIISFDSETLIDVSKILPNIKRGILVTAIDFDITAIIKRTGAEFVGMECRQLSADFTKQASEASARVFVWNIPDKQALKHALSFNIAGVIVDNINISG